MNECLGFQMSQGIHCLWYSKFAKQLLPKIIVILIFPVFVKKKHVKFKFVFKKKRYICRNLYKAPKFEFFPYCLLTVICPLNLEAV